MSFYFKIAILSLVLGRTAVMVIYWGEANALTLN